MTVIDYEEWHREFAADPHILERTIRLDGTVRVIVGVMPQAFAFPIRHRYWVPLRLTGADQQPGAGPALYVLGRLADGFSLSGARAELATVGDQMAPPFPQTRANVPPQVLPYTHAFIGIEGPEVELAVRGIQFEVGLLLVIIA